MKPKKSRNTPAENLPDPRTPAVLAAMRSHEAAGNAFESAGVRLCRVVQMLEDPAEPLRAAGKSDGEWHRDIFHRFLEFLHAAHALSEETRKMSTLSGGGDTLAVTPLASFMNEIRTCMTHRPVPHMTLVHFPPPVPRPRVLHMHISDMIAWPHWSPPARHFLHQHLPQLPLSTAVHSYLQDMRMYRQRAVRHFRAVFSEIIAAAPLPPVMIPLM